MNGTLIYVNNFGSWINFKLIFYIFLSVQDTLNQLDIGNFYSHLTRLQLY